MGAQLLRVRADKSRSGPYPTSRVPATSPAMLAELSQNYNLPVIVEIETPGDIEMLESFVGGFQLSADNMYHEPLLDALAHRQKPVILQRGVAATMEEFLLAAERVLAQGNSNVILCERGIRTFESATRFTLDLGVAALIKHQTHLPVMVDPGPAVGVREMVGPLARAAAAIGGDGVLIDTCHDPRHNTAEDYPTFSLNEFQQLMTGLKTFVQAAGRTW
jgi:3-deoxy-7-phosphoheptulonate synthase